MDKLVKTSEKIEVEEEFSFKKLFVPLTTLKAIHWIIIIGLIIYFNSLFNGFVLDDNYQIGPNLLSLGNLFLYFKGSSFSNFIPGQIVGVYYKPILEIVFSFVYSIFGQTAFPFHLLQIVLYFINSILLFFLLKRFFKIEISFFLALIFLVHPINSEVALYISDTQDILFFLAGIIALLTIIHFNSWKAYLFGSLCLILSILSKETGILFVIISLIYVLLFKRKKIVKVTIASIVVFILYMLLRIQAIGLFSTPMNAPIDTVGLGIRIINIPQIILFYLQTFIFPLNLASSYQWVVKELSSDSFYIPLLIDLFFFGIVSLFGFMLHKKYSKYFLIYIFFVIWFVIGLGMHLQIVPLDDIVADRWFYFPFAGLLGILAVVYSYFESKANKLLIVCFVILILFLFSVRSFIRTFDWRDNFTLYSHDVKISKSYSLQQGLSAELYTRGDFEESKKHALISINEYPYFGNYLNLGSAYLGLKDYQKARQAYLRSLRYLDYNVTYENLALLDILTNANNGQSIIFVNNALKKFPNDVKLLDSLAIFEYRQNNSDDAKATIAKAYMLSQDQETVYIYTTIMNNRPLNLRSST